MYRQIENKVISLVESACRLFIDNEYHEQAKFVDDRSSMSSGLLMREQIKTKNRKINRNREVAQNWSKNPATLARSFIIPSLFMENFRALSITEFAKCFQSIGVKSTIFADG